MADIVIVQDALTTGAGPQTFQSGESWTPVGALFFLSYGTAAGTAVDHAMFSIGATDGTNNRNMAFASEDGQATTDTGAITSTTRCVTSLLNTDQTLNAAAFFSAWTAGGVTLSISTPFPAGYLLTVVLFGPGAVANFATGNDTTPGVQDTSVTETLGFPADLVIAWTASANTTHSRPTLGFVINDGANKQRSINSDDGNGVTTSDVLSRLSTSYVSMPASATTIAMQIQEFDATSFKAYTRLGTTALPFHYVAIKLATGLTAKLVTSASPIGTGSHSITGAGITPQFGLMLHSANPTVDVRESNDDAEVFGLSAFTAGGSASIAIFSEDGLATGSDTESITDTKPVSLRKDHADFMTATFTAFNSDGAEFNYSTANGTARQRAVLFIQSSAGAAFTIAATTAPYNLTGTAAVLRPTSITILEHRR
jgi:hypothetical protein